jgi:hypothetical protein
MENSVSFLNNLIKNCPFKIEKILTDKMPHNSLMLFLPCKLFLLEEKFYFARKLKTLKAQKNLSF